jgi:hypothetical protein
MDATASARCASPGSDQGREAEAPDVSAAVAAGRWPSGHLLIKSRTRAAISMRNATIAAV